MPRWIKWVPLALLAAMVGFLLAVLFPRDTVEKPEETPTLVVTATIPRAEP